MDNHIHKHPFSLIAFIILKKDYQNYDALYEENSHEENLVPDEYAHENLDIEVNGSGFGQKEPDDKVQK